MYKSQQEVHAMQGLMWYWSVPWQLLQSLGKCAHFLIKKVNSIRAGYEYKYHVVEKHTIRTTYKNKVNAIIVTQTAARVFLIFYVEK
jgi:hypothetical protein